ncbi:MAG TPA: carbohydrate binding domain-containing protein [Pseudobacteroides sp.]|uniref:carbohydrate binding domain-containing protein n=1 Tax=Pseudobacteroides sp. TaxID=1968840 RepID=UPI002F95E0EE
MLTKRNISQLTVIAMFITIFITLLLLPLSAGAADDGSRIIVQGYIAPDLISSNANAKSGFKVLVSGTTVSQLTDANGFFKFEIQKKDGTIDLEVSKAGYLTRVVQKVAGNIDCILSTIDKPVLMYAGDVPKKGVQDSMINMIDVTVLASAFYATSSDPIYSPFADFNLDENIDMHDVIILAKHFGATTADYPAIIPITAQSPTPTNTTVPTPTPTNINTSLAPYTLAWSDDFDGDSINSDNWNVADTNVVYNNELEAYKTANAYVQDGNLVLEAKKEAYLGKNYTSGKVFTKGKQAWTYGRFEIKAKMPESQGIWPAIWMLPEDDNIYGGWPQGGEIDILELLGHQPNKIYGTVHYGNPHASGQGEYTLQSGKFSDSYHIYAFEWDPGEMRWYIDGTLYHTEKSWYTRDENEADSITYPAPFNRDFHLILNVAVGGDWPGNPDSTTILPSKMFVDYIKVYERKDGVYPPAGERPEINNTTARQPLPDGNYIYNGSFDQQNNDVAGMRNDGSSTDITNTSYWTFSHVDANNGVAEASNDNGAIKLDISTPGNNPYSVQIYQKPINVEKSDTYRVTFDAWASTERNMYVKVGSEADRGWANYSGDQIIALTTTPKEHTFDFKMTGDTNPAARLEFNVGAAGENIVHIDNVKLIKLPRDPNASREPLKNGNLIYNGSFDQGSKSMGFWNFKTSGNAVATGNVSDNIFDRYFQAAITNGGTGADSIVLSQSGLNIEKGKEYTVSFFAKAESARTIEADICSIADTPLVYPTEKSFSLTTDMTRYSFKFKMEQDTDARSQLRFKLGGNTAKVFIDNVFVKVSSQGIHVEAEDADVHGAITSEKDYVYFKADSYISKSITVPETGKYAISYKLSTSDANGWLSIGDTKHKESLPDTGGNSSWVNVTNSVNLNKGAQIIKIYGDAVNLDWFELSKDLVVGGSMTAPAADWAYWNTSGENAASIKSIDDGKLKVAITAVGDNPWSIGVNQSNISLEQGRQYRISFDAKSTINRKIRLSVDKADYSKYFSLDLDITNEMKNYIVDFPMSATDTNCTLTFSIGNVSGAAEAHDIYLDNVRMVEVADLYCQSLQSIVAPVITEDDTTAIITDIITDGTFETGIGAWGSYAGEASDPGAGAITLDATSGKLVADVTRVGDQNYKPQVKRGNLSLIQDKTYTLTFNASSTVDRAVEVTILDPNNNYQYFGGNKFVISNSATDYVLIFTAPATTTTAELQFNLGTIAGHESISVASAVSIDDVRLVEATTDISNDIFNETFDAGKASWSFNANGGAGSADIVANNNKELSVVVTTVGDANYKPQIQKSNITLENGVAYQLTLKARASVARTIELAFLELGSENQYDWYGGCKISVTDQTQTFTLTFTAKRSTTTAGLQINFGQIKDDQNNPLPSAASTIYLDDIVMVKQ